MAPNKPTPGNEFSVALQALSAAQLVELAPGWENPEMLWRATRSTPLQESLLRRLILLEEQARSGPLNQIDPKLWREQRWGEQVEQAFIEGRRRFERVSFWSFQVADKGQAMELYYQLCNGELSFAELVQLYSPEAVVKPSTGQEATLGLVRESPLHHLPKAVGKALRASRPRVPHKPLRQGNGFLLLMLEGWHPPSLDSELRRLLLKELEAGWLERELHRRLDRIASHSVP